MRRRKPCSAARGLRRDFLAGQVLMPMKRHCGRPRPWLSVCHSGMGADEAHAPENQNWDLEKDHRCSCRVSHCTRAGAATCSHILLGRRPRLQILLEKGLRSNVAAYPALSVCHGATVPPPIDRSDARPPLLVIPGRIRARVCALHLGTL
jgi:hypothetical protein